MNDVSDSAEGTGSPRSRVRAEVVDGDVDHRDSVLNEEEREANEYMMICVSRCRSARLTLDL